MISPKLKIIQLSGSDGDHVGLYMTERDDVENFQSDFDAALATSEDNDQDVADEWLAEHKQIFRVMAEEVTTDVL